MQRSIGCVQAVLKLDEWTNLGQNHEYDMSAIETPSWHAHNMYLWAAQHCWQLLP
jgi:hypothetical protein